MDNVNKVTNQKWGQIFHKMVADKKAIQEYIRAHGTIAGFSDGSVRFAKPL